MHVVEGVALSSQLSCQVIGLGVVRERPGFMNIVSEWLFEVDMQSHLHRCPCRMKMHMIGSADYDSIQLAADRIVHFAIVTKSLNVRVLFEHLSGTLIIDIRERHHVLPSQPLYIGGTATADSDEGEVELFRGGGCSE